MAKRGEVYNQYIDYDVNFRKIKYPRLEFKSAIIDDSNVAEGSISFIVNFGYYTLEGVVNV